MAENVSKIDINGETILDLTNDTVTEDNLVEGETAHGANGEKVTGKLKLVDLPENVSAFKNDVGYVEAVTLAVSGLPENWEYGQTYDVTINKTYDELVDAIDGNFYFENVKDDFSNHRWEFSNVYKGYDILSFTFFRLLVADPSCELQSLYIKVTSENKAIYCQPDSMTMPSTKMISKSTATLEYLFSYNGTYSLLRRGGGDTSTVLMTDNFGDICYILGYKAGVVSEKDLSNLTGVAPNTFIYPIRLEFVDRETGLVWITDANYDNYTATFNTETNMFDNIQKHESGGSSVDLSEYAKKSDIPVDGNVSYDGNTNLFSGNKGYADAQTLAMFMNEMNKVLASKADTSDITNFVTPEWVEQQGFTKTDNDTTYTQGTGITISESNEISVDMDAVTQSVINALPLADTQEVF